jgi:hypothetical protein
MSKMTLTLRSGRTVVATVDEVAVSASTLLANIIHSKRTDPLPKFGNFSTVVVNIDEIETVAFEDEVK